MGIHKKQYNTDLLYQIYRECDGAWLTMEKFIRANEIKHVPKAVETIKRVAIENDFLSRLEQDSAEEARELIIHSKAKKAKMMRILWRAIDKYEEKLADKKWMSEQGLKEVWHMLKVEMGEPTDYIKNENENSDRISFLEDILDDETSEPTKTPTEA